MKLGIAVVYAILPGDEELIDLHLRYIERCTRVPFTLYAAVSRLPSDVRERLAAKPYVRVCSIPTTDLRSSRENAYYLERLIATAIDEGSTHVATLHVDSFPIRDGWATDLATALSTDYSFAAIVRNESCDPKPMTAGLFFPREFYVRYEPSLLISNEEMQSATGRAYIRQLVNPTESGSGYGFLAFEQELKWFPLLRSNAKADHYYFGSIHGDLIFHLGAAAAERHDFTGAREWLRAGRVRRRAAFLLPTAIKRLIKFVIPQRVLFPEHVIHKRAYASVRKSLMTNPEGYVHYLRTGRH